MSITEKLLLENGYEKWKSNDVIFPYAECFYQKRIKDITGTKYFIDIIYYSDINDAIHTVNESYMGYLNINNPHYIFNHHNLTDLKTFEDECATFFTTFHCEYYEKY